MAGLTFIKFPEGNGGRGLGTLFALVMCLFSAGGAQRLDSLVLDHKPQTYQAPLYLKVLSVYEGKLYYELSGKKPTRTSPLYKGIIKLSSPKTYQLRFLWENPYGEEKHFGPYLYVLTPPKGFSSDLPTPTLPGGVYDSVLIIGFLPFEKADIVYALNDTANMARYTGQKIILDSSATLYFRGVYADTLSTDLFSEKYQVFLTPPRASLSTTQRTFNYLPKLAVRLEKAAKAWYSTDPLAPLSSFKEVGKYIELPEGRHILRLYAENIAGTRSEETRYTLTVDATPPDIKYFVDADKKQIKLSANEPAVIYYTLDGAAPNLNSRKYASPIPLPDQGLVPIKFFAVDTMGNESPLTGFNASADMLPPSVKLSPEPGAYTRPVQLAFLCSEECVVRYSLDGSDPALSPRIIKSAGSQVAIDREGENTLRYIAKDASGNTGESFISRYIIDSKPPKVRFKLIQSPQREGLQLEFFSNEPAKIHYTIDGSIPTSASPVYSDSQLVKAGTNFQFIAVDDLGNATAPRQLKEILTRTVLADPAGGIFNTPQQVSLRSLEGQTIRWKATRNDRAFEGEKFKPYTGPILLNYAGVYVISYFLEGKNEDKNIQEQMYIIDKTPPQIVPVLEKSSSSSIFFLIFETDEPAQIRYTLDGTAPETPGAVTAGSTVRDEEIKIQIQRRGKQVLRYFAEDRAGNRTPSYALDLFSPYATAQPPPGEYNSIISLKLISQKGNTIYYGRDSLTLSTKSTVYSKPILIKETQEVWFMAQDITGFAGPRQKAFFKMSFPPEPRFSIPKEKTAAGEAVEIDARLSADEETPPEQLLFRWDLNGDGIFDTPFSPQPVISTRFVSHGIHEVGLEVMDADSLRKSIQEKIQVFKACPSDMISVFSDSAGFCIDRYEWPNREGSLPLTGINWAEAAMLCIEKERRLCRQEEWESACRGKYGYIFSYGNSYDPGMCNTLSKEPQPAGSRPKCASIDQVRDLVGNVWEWVEDHSQGTHFLLGGSHEQSSAASCELEFPSQIGTQSPAIGFRCCQ